LKKGANQATTHLYQRKARAYAEQVKCKGMQLRRGGSPRAVFSPPFVFKKPEIAIKIILPGTIGLQPYLNGPVCPSYNSITDESSRFSGHIAARCVAGSPPEKRTVAQVGAKKGPLLGCLRTIASF